MGAASVGGGVSAQQEPPVQPLPLKDVVLFSSGVGYFQRAGRIACSATVGLSFRAEQVNDILKSLVILDPAGNVRPVSYTSRAGVVRGLRPGGPPVDNAISLGALLRQFQGARVSVGYQGESVEGRLLSISLRTIPSEKGPPVEVEVLNIHTDQGLRAMVLDQVVRVRLLDERLNRDLQQSLESLAQGLDDQRRQVELHFAGNEAREIRAGYLQEMPIWKTSYRLVLEQGKPAYLQGWGIVENTTDEDWKDVRLSLVSGRPVSFIQDLYQPLYIPRPVVQAQVIGSPVPQTYGETLAFFTGGAAAQKADGPAGPADAARGLRGGFGGAEPAPASPLPAEVMSRRAGIALAAEELGKSVQTQAQGVERGELFEYAIRQPISLERGKSAMVPIIGENVDGEAISIFDADSDEKHALAGFRLKNVTRLTLAGGPITVFKDGIYGGDAQVGHLRPGDTRLLSYAVDLDLVADREEPKFQQETTGVIIRSGVMHVMRKQRRERVYTFRNKTAREKAVLIQQNQEPGFNLAEPAKPEETTPDEYRFRLVVPANKTEKLAVVTERPLEERLTLIDMNLNGLNAYAQNGRLAEKVRAALKELLTRRRKIADLQGQRSRIDGELKAIDQEQARIRQNMEQLDRNSPLYAQYVKKLTEQEARIDILREQMRRLQEEEAAAQAELRSYLDGLNVE